MAEPHSTEIPQGKNTEPLSLQERELQTATELFESVYELLGGIEGATEGNTKLTELNHTSRELSALLEAKKITSAEIFSRNPNRLDGLTRGEDPGFCIDFLAGDRTQVSIIVFGGIRGEDFLDQHDTNPRTHVTQGDHTAITDQALDQDTQIAVLVKDGYEETVGAMRMRINLLTQKAITVDQAHVGRSSGYVQASPRTFTDSDPSIKYTLSRSERLTQQITSAVKIRNEKAQLPITTE